MLNQLRKFWRTYKGKFIFVLIGILSCLIVSAITFFGFSYDSMVIQNNISPSNWEYVGFFIQIAGCCLLGVYNTKRYHKKFPLAALQKNEQQHNGSKILFFLRRNGKAVFEILIMCFIYIFFPDVQTWLMRTFSGGKAFFELSPVPQFFMAGVLGVIPMVSYGIYILSVLITNSVNEYKSFKIKGV